MLTQSVATYLATRRATGFALRCQGFQLRSFAAFSRARGKRYVFSEVAIDWAGLAQSVSQRARRLGTVIRFARYLHAEDQHHEVPPAIFGLEKPPRPTPYILTPEQIRQLIDAASRRGVERSVEQPTAHFSLCWRALGCGYLKRSGCNFNDLTPDGLTIRNTKFRKSRLVPLHETAWAGLERYLQQRRPYAPSASTCSCRREEIRSDWSM
jgi:integrase/recombinase XerD